MKKTLIRLSLIPSVLFGIIFYIPYFIFTGKDFGNVIYNLYKEPLDLD